LGRQRQWESLDVLHAEAIEMMRAKNCLQAPHAKLIENEFQAKMALLEGEGRGVPPQERQASVMGHGATPIAVDRHKTNPLATKIKSTWCRHSNLNTIYLGQPATEPQSSKIGKSMDGTFQLNQLQAVTLLTRGST
jgi:hypothetical protein